MSLVHCCLRFLTLGVATIGLAGCAGQMPSVAGFMHSPTVTFAIGGGTDKKLSPGEHSFHGSSPAYSLPLGESIGATYGDRWRIGGQAAFPLSVSLTGGYLGEHFGSMNWIGTSFLGVSGGSALIEHTAARNWLEVGSFQYIARNEMIGGNALDDYSLNLVPSGVVGYFEVGAGLVLTTRKELWELPMMSLEGKMGRDLTFGFTRYYVTVSISRSFP
jgi:hypothetical protein